MRGLQLAIVPLVLSSLSLALCSMADPKRLGKIAGKTIGTFVGFYVCGATLAGLFAYFIKSMGWFSVNLPETTTSNVATLEAVSYTHLDVYKRQLLIRTSIRPNLAIVSSMTCCTTVSLSAPALTSAWTGRTSILYNLSSSSLASASFCLFLPVITRFAPVSYTHLDVYKRQILYTTKSKGGRIYENV